jgi:hypothetical protein
MQYGLLAAIVPLEHDAGPTHLGDGTLIILVFTPANANANAQ